MSVTFADQQLMDLFRAILRSGELSERVLDLTEDLLDENAANYTVWLDLTLTIDNLISLLLRIR